MDVIGLTPPRTILGELLNSASLPNKIFISYSHKDATLANGIARFLERRNFNVWIDHARIKARDKWATSVNEAIDAADLVIGILTADSVRRPQVIRELGRALDKTMPGNKPPLLLCVVGRIHDSWFYDSAGEACSRVIDYLHKYQRISFNAHANVTTDLMEELLSCITSEELATRRQTPIIDNTSCRQYVNLAGMPKKARDKRGTRFYKVYNDDLSSSTVYPFALDNQWIPRRVQEDGALSAAFEAEGFSDENIAEIVAQEQVKHLKVSLIHARQIIVNNSAILNSRGIRQFYSREASSTTGFKDAKERDAFATFLEDGSIVVFLYGADVTSPYVAKLPEYETDRNAIVNWNELCDSCRIYCIRENWNSGIDQHSIDFVRFCCTISDDIEQNIMLARSLGIREHEIQWFLATLKDVSVQGFVRTRLTGSNAYDAMRGLSRSYFYKDFIVRRPEGDSKPVLNCLFDAKKPFSHELKSIVDTYYNSLFTNYFQCREMLPLDEPPTNSFLNQLYLTHGTRQVSEQELEYAISEFLRTHCTPSSTLNDLPERYETRQLLRQALNTDFWTLDRIRQLRDSSYWLEYMDTKEASVSRIQEWRVDFCDIDRLGNSLFDALLASAAEMCPYNPHPVAISQLPESAQLQPDPLLDYTSLRICVGMSVIDAVIGEKDRKVTVYSGSFSPNQNRLLVYYQPGSIGCVEASDTILTPIKVFDGMTNMTNGDRYFAKLLNFFDSQDFEEVTN